MIARRLLCVLALLGCPGIPWAQSLPASVRACAAEADAERRHACYDREITRILDAEKAAASRQSPAPPQDAAARRTAPGPSTAASPTAAVVAKPAAAAPRESPADQANEPRVTATRSGDRVSARIVSIDTAPDELVMHLDNGEVWEQADRTSGGLGLRAGDTVTIEKHLGSYWLAARHVSGMKVRKKKLD